MKKYLIPALALGLVMTSCQSDEPFAPVEGGEKQVTFTLNVPGELGTRAAAGANKSDKGGATNQGAGQIEYTLVLKANNDIQILEHNQATVNGTTATFKPTVVLGREYTITAYASLNGAWGGEQPIAITNSFNDESKDAYFKTLKHNFAKGDLQPLTLTRPYGKLRLIAEDYDPAKTKVESVKITYANPQHGTFDATTETFTIASENVAGTTKEFGYYEAADVAGAHTIFAEYLPTPKDKESEYPVSFTVEVKYDGSTETYSRTFNDIPVRRNALTTLSGNFFTAGAEITVKVDENFDGEAVNKSFVSTASQLQDAINKAPQGQTTEIILDDDIDLTGSLVFGDNSGSPAPTRSGAAKSFVLDLNGKTINAPYDENSTTEQHIYAIKNYSDLTIKNGTINARGNFNYGRLTIEEGVTINAIDGNGGYGVRNYSGAEFVMNGGTIATTYEDDNQVNKGGYDATTLRVDEGARATINRGTINNICDFTFAIENHGETIVNGGTITSIHSTVSNYGTMTIKGGSFTCNGLEGITAHALVVWDGSSTTIEGGVFDGKDNYNGFNVDAAEGATVYIRGGEFRHCHSGSLYGDGTIVVSGGKFFDEIADNRLADGYKAVKNQQGDKYYVVQQTDADVAVTTATDLNAALAEGSKVVFVNDIAVAKSEAGSNSYGATGVNQLNGGVIYGNGKKLSVNAWGTWDSALNTTGGTIKNLNVTGGMRGIFVNHNSENSSKVILENVVIDGTVYTISCDQGTNKGLEATNSTFNGWTSYAATIGEVLFTNCSFGKGQGYAFCRPYAPTKFVGCNFVAGYEIDARAAVTFENCTINGVELTAQNLATLVTSNTANATVK